MGIFGTQIVGLTALIALLVGSSRLRRLGGASAVTFVVVHILLAFRFVLCLLWHAEAFYPTRDVTGFVCALSGDVMFVYLVYKLGRLSKDNEASE